MTTKVKIIIALSDGEVVWSEECNVEDLGWTAKDVAFNAFSIIKAREKK